MFNVALKAVGDSFHIAFISDMKFCHTEFQLLVVITCNDLNLAPIPLEKFSCLEFYICFLFSQLLQSKYCLEFYICFSVFSVAAKQVLTLQSVIQWPLLLSTFLCFSERSIIAMPTVRLALHMPFEFACIL
jgi:hypothetical protein